MKAMFERLAWLGLALALSAATSLAQTPASLSSLRGAEISAEEPTGEHFKFQRDRPPWPRDYPQQVPLIPHNVKGYGLTRNFNKCLDCHSWSQHELAGAPKVALSHYLDREGKRRTSLAPRYYFCMQCHLPQTDARPLVSSTYRPARPEVPAAQPVSVKP